MDEKQEKIFQGPKVKQKILGAKSKTGSYFKDQDQKHI